MRVPILSDQEVQVLLSYLDTCPHRDNLIIRLMLQCGLRAGEVSKATIDNAWRSGFVHPAIYLPQGTTKNHKARYVDMPGPVRDLVAKYVPLLLEHSPQLTTSGPLFTSYARNQKLTVRSVENIAKLISQRAIGRQVHPHVLRHTYATILLRYTNIRVVQQLLGHSRLDTTQIYTHVSSEDCKTAVNQAFNH